MSWSLASGDILAHYRVLSPLGAGGMGQVYLAEDVRLGRKLALKILAPHARRDEGRLQRFVREARTVSTLNHPNILTIYDVGEANGLRFIATEYVEGLTLRSVLDRGRLALRQALDVGVQIAQAVSAAHDAGVIHRDLKPENVMIRADGYVKVLDFGLAKLAAPESFLATPDAATALLDTQDGVVMGTFSYMAPEQARGMPLDARADQFALGVMLYEMLAGEPPFKGPTPADVVGALLYRDAEPLSRAGAMPDGLDQIVSTALQKDRDLRYPTCAQLLDRLRSIVSALDAGRSSGTLPAPPGRGWQPDAIAAPPRRRRARRTIESVAVLPLVNQSMDPDLEYLTDGLTESLINNLSQIPRLRVMARSTVFRYKGRDTDPQVIGRDLDVRAVLTGHVEQRGDAFVVGAELVDVEDGSQLWGTSLNRRPSDVFVLQAEISRELTDALRLRLTRDERRRLAKRHTANAEAYQLYLRGRYFLNKRTGEALTQSRALFERAVAEDPAYALAYAGLADCCSLIAVSFRTPGVDSSIEDARAAALKALALDDGLAEAHASLAFIKFRFDWNWPGAEAEFARALELNPGHAPSRQWNAMFLASQSRFEAALTEMTRALELDPLSLIIQTGLGRILHFAGRYDEAIAQFEHVLQTDADFAQARIDLALTRMARGEFSLARAQLDQAEDRFGSASTIVLLKGTCAAGEGRIEDARAAFTGLRERYDRGAAGPDDLAMLAAVLGDSAVAVHWLREACARRAPFLGYVTVEPAMTPLLRDPGCRALLEEHGFHV